jgi:hypothetical protein
MVAMPVTLPAMPDRKRLTVLCFSQLVQGVAFSQCLLDHRHHGRGDEDVCHWRDFLLQMKGQGWW